MPQASVDHSGELDVLRIPLRCCHPPLSPLQREAIDQRLMVCHSISQIIHVLTCRVHPLPRKPGFIYHCAEFLADSLPLSTRLSRPPGKCVPQNFPVSFIIHLFATRLATRESSFIEEVRPKTKHAVRNKSAGNITRPRLILCALRKTAPRFSELRTTTIVQRDRLVPVRSPLPSGCLVDGVTQCDFNYGYVCKHRC